MGLTEDSFIHLHTHSNFSFLDGATPPERLIQRAAELQMPALALTDHHGLYGAVRFMQAAVAMNIKPILGVEIVVQPAAPERDRRGWSSPFKRQSTSGSSADGFHLVLLAKNRKGYSSLCRIVSKAQLDHQDDPKITLDDLAPLAKHVIALSACTRGELACALPGHGSSDYSRAEEVVDRYQEIFGKDNFWVELQHHLLPGDDLRNQQLVGVARRCDAGWVITNNAHYALPREYQLRDVMACIQTNTSVEEWADVRHRNAEYYLKTRQELAAAFSALPRDVIERGMTATIDIAAQCDIVGPQSGESLLATVTRAPVFEVPPGETAFSYLYSLCNEGLYRKYQPLTVEAVKRLTYELNVVEQMDLSDFFLCVWDIVRFSKESGIRCAGRGSAADSIIAYVLDITTVDPLANNLLFDRFLNPGRVGMPDIDIDFCSRRRDKVIEYIQNKYGPEHAAMVANLVTYRSRSAFRDVAKAMGYPPGLIDHIASSLSYRSVKQIRDDLSASGITWKAGEAKSDLPSPNGHSNQHPAVQLGQASRSRKPEPEPKPLPAGPAPRSINTYGQLELIIELCEQMDGYPRHLSLHNGGMLITREPLVDIVPLEYATSGVRVCQFNKDDVEALGLIKFDILGLRTLSIIDEALEMLRKTGLELPIDDLPLDDPAVYDFICTSKTIGVFQIESPGQWHLLQRAQPRTFGDLIIQIALFRPGPLQGDMVNPYIERRTGRQPVTYLHPSLEDALRDTLGVVIFQEQVLQVAHDFAGLSYADADGLRRAMSHYRTDAEMDVCREAFVESAVGLGRDREMAEDMYNKLTCFSGYGFCRSHAAAFAKTVYQTAFLKTYYPAELLAGILSNEPCCYYPAQTVIEEARKWDIQVLPVDVNRSLARYSIEPLSEVSRPGMRRASAIRMGFIQIKGISEEVADSIVAARKRGPFRSLPDFWRRTSVDRDAVHDLIAIGAFDSLAIPRRRLMWELDEVVRTIRRPSRPSPARALSRQPGQPKQLATSSSGGNRVLNTPANLSLPLEVPHDDRDTLPEFPALSELELASLDMTLQNASANYSVMMFYRRSLRELRIMSIGEVQNQPNGLIVKTAGIIISRQQPPTAKGMTFLVLSDEEGELPAAIPPQLYAQFRKTLGSSSALVIEGLVQRHRRYVSIMIRKLWNLRDIAELDPNPTILPERLRASAG
jgi:error-prone DNA polymerase